jgi:UDP-N-acetylmuramate--alanine ligase
MNDQASLNIKSMYFIGVGGAGMSGIALLAHELGYEVAGSDLKESRYTKELKRRGIHIEIGHAKENLEGRKVDVVVKSTAVPEKNPELKFALKNSIPVWPRAKMLAHLGEGYKTLAVAGTHGKTTTSSMLASALYKLNADPSLIIGGIVNEFEFNARHGNSDYYVVEADESDGSFTYLKPFSAIITNIEADHLDFYSGLEEIKEVFSEFVSSISKDGVLIICNESNDLEEIAQRSAKCKVITVGFKEGSDYRLIEEEASVILQAPDGSAAILSLDNSPGRHNLLNAACVVAHLNFLGFDLKESAAAVKDFKGVKRRFDLIGEAKGIKVFDDYAHHPTEVAATLAAAKSQGFRRVSVIFQPHRYSRTQALASDFGSAFKDADTLLFLDVYAAGEMPIPGVNGRLLLEEVKEVEPNKLLTWIPERQEAVDFIVQASSAGDAIFTMGAGDVTLLAPEILKAIEENDRI